METLFDDELQEYLRLIEESVQLDGKKSPILKNQSIAFVPDQRLNISKEFSSADKPIFEPNQFIFNQLTPEPAPQMQMRDLTRNNTQNIWDTNNFNIPSLPKRDQQNFQPHNQFSSFIEFREEIHCLCNLDLSLKPTRNLIIKGIQNQYDFIIQFLKKIGDVQNIDRHLLNITNSMIVSYYDFIQSNNAYNQLLQNFPFLTVSFVADFNDFEFIDYMIITNAGNFHQKLVEEYLNFFGNILECQNVNDKFIIRYSDVRSLKEVERLISLLERDKKSFLFLHRSHFQQIDEKFILELMKNIFIFNRENTTDIMMKHTKSIHPSNSSNCAKYQQLPISPTSNPINTSNNMVKRNPLQELKGQGNCDKQKPKKVLSLEAQCFQVESKLCSSEDFSLQNSSSTISSPTFNPLNLSSSLNFDQHFFNSANVSPNMCFNQVPNFGGNGCILQEESRIQEQENKPNEDDGYFSIDLMRISCNLDSRSTIMIRNIPNRYNQVDFLRIIDVKFKGLYDFLYLPMDFKNHCNIGYAFLNFIDPKYIINFVNEFHGKRWDYIRSEKICIICYARIQGRNELISHFKKSGVMNALVDRSFKPLILPNPSLDLQIFYEGF